MKEGCLDTWTSNMDTPHNSYATQRRTVTQTVIRRNAGQAGNTSAHDRISHLLDEDPWEKSPKTDYTYSHSVSYFSRGKEGGLPSPNMSRPRLRTNATFYEIPRPSPSVPPIVVSEVEASRETSVAKSHESHVSKSSNEFVTDRSDRHRGTKNLLSASFSGESHSSFSSGTSQGSRKSINRSVRRSVPPNMSLSGLPPSATRAGTRYGLAAETAVGSVSPSRRKRGRKSTGAIPSGSKRRSTRVVHETVEYDEQDESYLPETTEDERSVYMHQFTYSEPPRYGRQHGKLFEHSDVTTSYKESSLEHLYGLDQTDEEYSDNEVTFSKRRRRRRSSSSNRDGEVSAFSTVVTTTVTVITTIFTWIGKCLVYPFAKALEGGDFMYRKVVRGDEVSESLLWRLWVAICTMVTSSGRLLHGLVKGVVDTGRNVVTRASAQDEDEGSYEEAQHPSNRRRSRRLREKKVSSLAAESEAESDFEADDDHESSRLGAALGSVWSFIKAVLLFPLALVKRLGKGTAGSLAWVWAHMFRTAASEETGPSSSGLEWEYDLPAQTANSRNSSLTKTTVTTTETTKYGNSRSALGGKEAVSSAEMSDTDDDLDPEGVASGLSSLAGSGSEQEGPAGSLCAGLLYVLLAPWGLLKWLSHCVSNTLSWLFQSDSEDIAASRYDTYDEDTTDFVTSSETVQRGTGAAEVKASDSVHGSVVESESVLSEENVTKVLSTGTGATPVKELRHRQSRKQKRALVETEEYQAVYSDEDSDSDGLCLGLLKTLGSWLFALLLFPLAVLRWLWSGITYPVSGAWAALFGDGETGSPVSHMASKMGTVVTTAALYPFGLVRRLGESAANSVSYGWTTLFGSSDQSSDSLVTRTAKNIATTLGAILFFPFGLLWWLLSGLVGGLVRGWNWLFGSEPGSQSRVTKSLKTLGYGVLATVLSPFALLGWVGRKTASGLSSVGTTLFGGVSSTDGTAAHGMQAREGLLSWAFWGLCGLLKNILLLPLAIVAWLSNSLISSYYKWIHYGVVGGLLGQMQHGAATVHRGLAKNVLTDVWLLSKTSYYRRRYTCCCLLPILLIPLLLTILYYLWDQQLVENWYGAGSESWAPLGAVLTSTMSSVSSFGAIGAGRGASSEAQMPVVLVGNETDKELQEKLQVILVGLLRQQEEKQQKLVAADQAAWERQQATLLGAYRTELEQLVRAIVDRELALFAAKMDSQHADTLKQAKDMVAAAVLSDDQLSSKVQSLLVLLLDKHDERQQGLWLQKEEEWRNQQQLVLNTYQNDMTVLVKTLVEKEATQAAAVAVGAAAKEAANVAVGAVMKEESEKQQASNVERETTQTVVPAALTLDEEALSAKVAGIVAALLQQQEAAQKQQWDAMVVGWAESRDRDQAELLATLDAQVKEVIDKEAAILLAKLESDKAAMLAAATAASKEAVDSAEMAAADKVAAAGIAAIAAVKQTGESMKTSMESSAPNAHVGAGVGVAFSESDIKEKVQSTTVVLLQQHEEKVQQQWLEKQRAWEEQQAAAFADYKSGVSVMTANAITAQVQEHVAAALLAARGESAAANAKLTATQEEQAAAIGSLQAQLQEVIAKSQTLSAELAAARSQMNTQFGVDSAAHNASVEEVHNLEARLAGLKDSISQLQATQAAFALQLKDCCKNDTALAALIAAGVQRHMAAMMGGGSEGTAAGAGGATFMDWLQGQFAKREDIDDRVTLLAAKVQDEMKTDAVAAAIAAVAAREASSHSDTSTSSTMVNIGMGGDGSMTDERVKQLIREALLIFAADKTGQVDYALESAGGSVISTRCSETYHRHTAQLSLFGIPLWYASNSPRTVIQPDIYPGQCWAFRGKQGYLVMQLSGPVQPTSFSLEHIPKSLSPSGRIDSAPRDFSVLGLIDERDTQGKVLGNYTYSEEGDPLQYFLVKDPDPGDFTLIELRILNNHGNEEYTCLYRFRVHGIPK